VNNETILIVEDSALNRKLVETILRPYGYRLLIAVDGGEAIEIATREQPDLVLMDMQLPKVSGYDATRTLKAQPETADIPIVALTAHAMEDERERAKAVGCDGYITKPIDTRAFPGQVREHLDEHVKRQASSVRRDWSNPPDSSNPQ
jgi:two-component system cell cycle response regulator DivK